MEPSPPSSDAAPSGIGAALAARIVAVAAGNGTSPAEPTPRPTEAAPAPTTAHVAADAPPPPADTPAVNPGVVAGAMVEGLHPSNGDAAPAEAPPLPPPPPDLPRARVAYTHTPCTTSDRPGPGVLPVLCNNRPGWLLLPALDDGGALADLPRVECGCRACSTYPHRPALTLPDYEKHAGAAHNKKWRTSVRVVGELGGAHAPEALAGGALGAAAALNAGPPLGVWLEDRGLWDAAKHARSGRPSPATSDADASRGGTPPALSPRGDRKRRAPGWLADTVTSSSLRLPYKSGKGGVAPPPPPPLAPPLPPPAVFDDDAAPLPTSSELRIVHYRPTPGGGLYLEVALDGRLYGGEVARARAARAAAAAPRRPPSTGAPSRPPSLPPRPAPPARHAPPQRQRMARPAGPRCRRPRRPHSRPSRRCRADAAAPPNPTLPPPTQKPTPSGRPWTPSSLGSRRGTGHPPAPRAACAAAETTRRTTAAPSTRRSAASCAPWPAPSAPSCSSAPPPTRSCGVTNSVRRGRPRCTWMKAFSRRWPKRAAAAA